MPTAPTRIPREPLIIMTHHSKEYQPLANLTQPNKDNYLNMWGHDFLWMPKHERGWSWSKVHYFMNMPEEPGRWYLWMGCDTMFMRFDVDISQYCSPSHDLIICENGAGLWFNAEVFLVRATKAAKEFFKRVWEDDKNTQFLEQDAMTRVVMAEDCPCRVNVRNDRAFNGLPPWAGLHAYQQGDLVAHAAGFRTVQERINWLEGLRMLRER